MEFFFEPVPHKEAIDFIKSKPAVSRDVFNHLLPALKARAFVIAGVEAANVVQSVRDTIATLPAGGDWKKIRKQIAEEIHPYVANPEDPDNTAAAMRRAELLIRTHGFQAYQATNVATMRRQADVLPYWQYLSMQDGRVRAAHRALEGKVLPADHPFWHDHTPPWGWGCRCQIVPLSPEDVADLNEREKDKAPEERSVLPPHVLAEIERTGHLVTGPSNVVDVRSDKAKGVPGAFEWDPLSMSLPMDQLKSRYDAPVWAAFEGWAKANQIPETGVSVWGWLNGEKFSLAAPQPIYDAEKRIAGDKGRETAVACNSAGTVLLEKTGEPDRVEFTVAEMQAISGSTLTHNHPTGESFSLNDLHVGLHAALVELRVVGTNSAGIVHLHSLRPASGTWRSAAWPQIEKAFLTISNEAETFLRAEIASGRMSPEQAGDEHNHIVLSRLAAKYPNIFIYERTRL